MKRFIVIVLVLLLVANTLGLVVIYHKINHLNLTPRVTVSAPKVTVQSPEQAQLSCSGKIVPQTLSTGLPSDNQNVTMTCN